MKQTLFFQMLNPKFFRATLARAARNRLNFWREGAREARRLTPVIKWRRRALRAARARFARPPIHGVGVGGTQSRPISRHPLMVIAGAKIKHNLMVISGPNFIVICADNFQVWVSHVACPCQKQKSYMSHVA